MKLDQLQHFVAIVEHGSLRAAARRLNQPQPAVTRSIRALEKDLDVTLFLRETTGMVLTAAGRRFHRRASAMLNEARRARDEIAQHSGDDQGTVVVALSIMPHLGLLPHALAVFRKRYPGVMLQLIEGLFPDVESALRDGSIDFYLGAAPRSVPAPGLSMQVLMENRRAVVCRKGHPLGKARHLKELGASDWAITGVDYNALDDMAALFASYDMAAPRVVLRARSAMSMMVALAHSDLLAMLPIQWAQFPMTRNTLQTIQIAETLPAPTIVLIRRPDLPLTPAAEYFCDLMKRELPA